MKEILKIRRKIDKIDVILVKNFIKRQELSYKIAQIKFKNDIPIFDDKREKEIIDKFLFGIKSEDKEAVFMFLKNLFSLSKIKQSEYLKTFTKTTID